MFQLVPGDDRVVRHICIECIVDTENPLLQTRINETLVKTLKGFNVQCMAFLSPHCVALYLRISL